MRVVSINQIQQERERRHQEERASYWNNIKGKGIMLFSILCVISLCMIKLYVDTISLNDFLNSWIMSVLASLSIQLLIGAYSFLAAIAIVNITRYSTIMSILSSVSVWCIASIISSFFDYIWYFNAYNATDKSLEWITRVELATHALSRGDKNALFALVIAISMAIITLLVAMSGMLLASTNEVTTRRN